MDREDTDSRVGCVLTTQAKRSDPTDSDPSLGLELGDQAAPSTRRFLELLLRGAYLQTQSVGGGKLRERVLWLTRDAGGQPILAIGKRKTKCLASDTRTIPMYGITQVRPGEVQTSMVEIQSAANGGEESSLRVTLPSVGGAAIFVRHLRALLVEMGVDVCGEGDGPALL